MSLWDIAGYTFRADEYCPDHIVQQLDGQAPVPANEAEAKLDYLAVMLGIDREDERSYDSGDFPKVIFADQVHDVCTAGNDYQPGQCGDCCGSCGKQLGGECPNKKEAVKLTADDSGCWVDGHWGRYAVAHLVQRAEELGYADAEVISLADRHMDDLGSRTTSLSDDEYWALNEASSEVENWLNDNVVPEGYSFGWHEGEFFLWPQEQMGGMMEQEYYGAGTESQCKAALQLLVRAIPEEMQSDETFNAADRLYTLISNAYDI